MLRPGLNNGRCQQMCLSGLEATQGLGLWVLEPDCPDWNPRSTTSWQCDLRQVLSHLSKTWFPYLESRANNHTCFTQLLYRRPRNSTSCHYYYCHFFIIIFILNVSSPISGVKGSYPHLLSKSFPLSGTLGGNCHG